MNLTNAQIQAPEPGVLKRQRSRPSDWWAAKPSNASPLPVHAPVAVVREDVGRIDAKEGEGGQKKTKRGRPSGGVAAGMKEVMGAGNRGRKGEGGGVPVPVVLENENGTAVKLLRRGRSIAGEAEIRGLGDGNEEGEGKGQVGDKSRGKKKIAAAAAKRRDNALEKPLRRGRSSAGETELRILDEASGDVATDGDEGLKGKKRGRPAAARASNGPVGQIEAQGVPRRRGRLSAVRDAEQVDELLGEQSEVAIVPKRSGRISAGSAGKVVEQEPERVVASRKRSRRSTGRVEDQDDELVDEGPGDEIAPKKRGRPPTAPTEGEPEEQLPKASRKPGRQPLSHTEEAQKSTSAPSGQPQLTKKRGRLAPAENLADLVPEDSTPWNMRMRRPVAEAIEREANRVGIENTPARGRARHRRSDVVEKEQSQPVEQERGRKRIRQSDTQAADEETVERGKRGTRRSDVESGQLVPKPKVAAGSTKPTKSSRRSEVVEVETASSKLTKNRANKRSKPSNNTAPAAKKGSSSIQTTTKAKRATRLSNATSSAPSQTHKKGSKRTSQIEAPQRKRKGAGSKFHAFSFGDYTDIVLDTEPAPSKRQRIEKSPEQEQDREPEPDLLNYQHLEAVTRRVSRQTIEAKWEALPPIGIERISQLLGDLQRPVVARLNDERKKTQAGTALEGISRKLITKISRGIPFPPGTRNHREDDFDFEKILDHNRALEAQLTPTLHSNELLEAELSKEMARLESDMEILAELERNAKTEASVRNQAGRKLHSVLQPDGSTREIELLKDDIGLNVDQQFQSSDLGVGFPFTEVLSLS